MIKKFQTYVLTAFMALLPAVTILVPAGASAALQNCNNIAGNVASGVTAASGSSSTDCNTTGLGTSDSGAIGRVASKIVNIFSIVVGAVAVIMIIFGGFRYITSGGDSGRVGGAKNTLLYALIGLVIVALAQIIVHYVLSQANSIGS